MRQRVQGEITVHFSATFYHTRKFWIIRNCPLMWVMQSTETFLNDRYQHLKKDFSLHHFISLYLVTDLGVPEISFILNLGPRLSIPFFFLPPLTSFFPQRKEWALHFYKHQLDYSRSLFLRLEVTCSAVRTTCQLHRGWTWCNRSCIRHIFESPIPKKTNRRNFDSG